MAQWEVSANYFGGATFSRHSAGMQGPICHDTVPTLFWAGYLVGIGLSGPGVPAMSGSDRTRFLAGCLPGSKAGRRLASSVARSAFHGPITYASILIEAVDWTPFDIVSVDYYRCKRSRSSYGERVNLYFATGNLWALRGSGAERRRAPRTKGVVASLSSTAGTPIRSSPGTSVTSNFKPVRSSTCSGHSPSRAWTEPRLRVRLARPRPPNRSSPRLRHGQLQSRQDPARRERTAPLTPT
jgi:hypothetical protein